MFTPMETVALNIKEVVRGCGCPTPALLCCPVDTVQTAAVLNSGMQANLVKPLHQVRTVTLILESSAIQKLSNSLGKPSIMNELSPFGC